MINMTIYFILIIITIPYCSDGIILSVYSPCSDRVGLPLPRGVNEEYWSSVFQPDALPDVNHMRGMQYSIVLNIIFRPEIN